MFPDSTRDPAFAGVYDEQLTRPDGRTVAWTRSGLAEETPGVGIPVVRMPGTPGSRWMILADRRGWSSRGVEMITTERPGFGQSTRLPGRGFREHADDVVAVLDYLGIERARLCGISGGGPHVLAFVARYPDRVDAATIVVGLPRVSAEEASQMIDLNRDSHHLARAGNADGLRQLYEGPFQAMSTDPLAGVAAMMSQAPEADQLVMKNPLWQKGFAASVEQAFAQGLDGWVDEDLAFGGDWADIPLSAIRTSLTWWHGKADMNCPWSAAQRLVDQLPTATLRDVGEVGHFASFTMDTEILEELLTRPRC